MNKDFVISMVEVESKLVSCCIRLISIGDEKLELGGEKVSACVVLSTRHLGAGHSAVANINGPVFCDSFKSWFYGC